MALKIGTKVDSFALPGIVEGEVRRVTLREHAGRWVIPFFYARDRTSVCSSEVLQFEDRFQDFAQYGIDILGISVDSLDSHRDWIAELGGLSYPLLSDADKALARSWDVLTLDGVKALRASFIIDPEGILQFQLLHSPQVAPNIDELLRFAQALQTGELCPAGWQLGEETLGHAA